MVLITYASIFLKDAMVLQTLIIINSTFVIMALVGFVHPIRNSVKNLIDEFVIILVMDLLFFSSDPMISPSIRLYIGWVLIAIVALSIIVNQGSLIVGSIKQTKLSC